jgi:two-component system CheB/CheR fusion protein
MFSSTSIPNFSDTSCGSARSRYAKGHIWSWGQSETVSSLREYFVVDDSHLKIYRRRGNRSTVPATRLPDAGRQVLDTPSARPIHRPYPVQTLVGRQSEEERATRLVEAENRWLSAFQDVTSYQTSLLESQHLQASLREESVKAGEQLEALVNVVTDVRKANDDLMAENLELRSANEEFLVGNEELQASAEEVETLNEELQASNEELETLNEELQATVEELNATNEDLHARSRELEDSANSLEEARGWSESERGRMEAIVAGMADAVLVVDENEEPVMTNQAFRSSFGSDGRTFIVNDAEGNAIPADKRPQASAARGEAFSMEFSSGESDGPTQYEVVGRPIRVGGEFHGGVLVLRDITDRSLRRLQDEFIATASHELRTPLTVLKGYVSLLRNPGYSDERRQEFLRLASDQTVRMERLISDLTDVVRLQTGRLSLRLSAVDLNDVARRSIQMTELVYGDRTFELSAASRALGVQGDAERLQQVFLNLLLNAAEYTPEGDSVSVSVRRRRGWGIVTVADSGPGIAPEDLPHLFTRFFRSNHESERQGGLGLGLYITKQLVEAHAGTIAVGANSGKGTRFTVSLPIASRADEKKPAPRASRRRHSGTTLAAGD